MPPVPVKHVISFTSQDPKHPVKDLVDGRGPWLCQQGDKSRRLQLDLQLEQATKITYIDIGNGGSVMIGVEVGRSAWPSDRPLVTLIPTTTFMTLAELNCGQNRNSVHMFKHEDMKEATRNEEWDRVRILCSQPFPSTKQYGLSLFKMYTDVKARMEPQLITPQKDHSLRIAPDKRNEFITKMNLSNSKKTQLSERIKSLEVSRLHDGGKEPVKVHHPSSPLSRAAQLVTLAAKIPTQQETVASKSELEREGLRFLMSLNLSVSEMDSLPIKDLRLKFEDKRQKQLNFAERKIFRNIAIDYAKRRMEVLEKDIATQLAAKGVRTSEVPVKALQQKRKYDHTSMENEINKEVISVSSSSSKSKLTTQESGFLRRTDKTHQENVTPARKFTFGHSRKAEKPLDIVNQQTDESHAPSKLPKNSVISNKQKEKISYSRNALSLLDSHVTPKVPRKRKSKKTDNKELKQESIVGQWITPTNKKKLEEKKFQYSVRGHHYSDSDNSDNECSIENSFSTPRKKSSSSSLHKSSSVISRTTGSIPKGNHLGAAPTNKYNSAGRQGEQSVLGDNQQWVECPLCSNSFPAEEIETHAASCNVTALSSSDGSSPFRISPEPSCSRKAESCPVCGVQVAASALESHATQCASTMFD
ncbi:uncharacterized protein LOC127006536 isoform X1 [Eriocheir sinensis]|uniref:uncharacterized protein LOC127006536 isoform X1 n=2 Tax=Eriocheir sinensis TaxID=95602 RepID=UPI0021C5E13F|nr:uncharacterized protein LOC127006536 isoform X1 [Eriocheir sinensis]